MQDRGQRPDLTYFFDIGYTFRTHVFQGLKMFVCQHLFFVRRRDVIVTLARLLVCHVTIRPFRLFRYSPPFAAHAFLFSSLFFVVVPGCIAGV